MSKLKNPLLSLDARGTLGEAVTFTRRRKTNLIEEKPIPTYRRTLAQVYQRWLYEDYAYLWRQQSLATQRQYASNGVRHHLTGFQYWMKYQLTNLPDILAWWKMDDNVGARTIDSSRNLHHLTIIGASPQAGVIGGAFLFDGINDYLRGPTASLAIGTSDFTFTGYFHTDKAGRTWIYEKRTGVFGTCIFIEGNVLKSQISDTSPRTEIVSATVVNSGVIFAFALTYDRDGNCQIYLNGVADGAAVDITAQSNSITTPLATLYVGVNAGLGEWFEDMIDDLRCYTRLLDQAEITRHAERRYP